MSNKASGSLEQRAADDGAAILGMESLDHIVCFDMAQLLGDSRVGASVCLRNGRPSKKSTGLILLRVMLSMTYG